MIGTWIFCVAFTAAGHGFSQSPESDAPGAAKDPDAIETVEEEPWDYSPYRVLIWIASRENGADAESIREPLMQYLDRDFFSIWRTTIEEAPPAVVTAAFRSMDDLTYASITASDPVIAVRNDHEDAIRIASVQNLPEFVDAVYTTRGLQSDVIRRAGEFGDEKIGGTADRLEPIQGDAVELVSRWSADDTEALLINRGQASTLDKPRAKLIAVPVTDLVSTAIDTYDKIFIVKIADDSDGQRVEVSEMETLMQSFGEVASAPYYSTADLPSVVGFCITQAFSPMVRIDDAGMKTASGMLRAGNLIMDENSPANIPVGAALEPMVRKNDRNGKPILIGRLDWAFLIATERAEAKVEMDYYSGMPGGLQGRKNKRTFKMARMQRPKFESTLLRLHAKGRDDIPLIGYELYEKELKSKKMTFVGRTDWNGRLQVEKSDQPMRLLYVKNGGAVLARLPMVPGLTTIEVADMSGDDLRLEAESYVRGVQNAIIDLVAIRKLLAARIRLRLKKGQMEEAENLLNALMEQPTNEQLSNDMGKKQAMFVKEIGRNANQRRKVDLMFKETREMLGKQINPTIIRELEADLRRARENGGKLPDEDSIF
ncbi:MAG: hypothetical protein AAGJ83_04780 [Planctomycetota bacterium]